MVRDFREALALGLARGGSLLTAGERSVAGVMLGLTGPPAVLYARLTGRVRHAFRLPGLVVLGVEDLPSACAALVEVGLADPVVSSATRAACSTREQLVRACRALGLPVSGRKHELAQRLAAVPRWDRDPWLRIRHRALIRRLERWAMLDAWPDRGAVVAARIGVARWPTYEPTPGVALFPHRRAMCAWEALADGPFDPTTALAGLGAGAAAGPGRMDLRRRLVGGLLEHARALERGAPDQAAALYRATSAHVRLGAVAVRWARAEERAGRPAEALEVLRAARRSADVRPSEHVAVGRAGRRLGRTLRAGLPPAPPLELPRRRTVPLAPAPPRDGRPRWDGGDGAQPVERAVIARLAAEGRTAVRAEAAPWSTLFSLLFAELYFLPVHGALPMPLLSGPLDLGSPRFRAARRDACEALWDSIERGEAPARVRDADARWRGVRLAGARWDTCDAQLLETLAASLGPHGLRAVLEPMSEHGPRAAAGMPDLVVLPGPEIRLTDAHPTRVAASIVLVEVKGPGDSVRDEQLVWHDRLTRAGVPIEVWEIVARR
ncbi:MAG: VRR-NUC domain-containing protein [Myxococcota bacterium]